MTYQNWLCRSCQYFLQQSVGFCGLGKNPKEYVEGKEPCKSFIEGRPLSIDIPFVSRWDYDADYKIEQAPLSIRKGLIYYKRKHTASYKTFQRLVEIQLVYLTTSSLQESEILEVFNKKYPYLKNQIGVLENTSGWDGHNYKYKSFYIRWYEKQKTAYLHKKSSRKNNLIPLKKNLIQKMKTTYSIHSS